MKPCAWTCVCMLQSQALQRSARRRLGVKIDSAKASWRSQALKLARARSMKVREDIRAGSTSPQSSGLGTCRDDTKSDNQHSSSAVGAPS